MSKIAQKNSSLLETMYPKVELGRIEETKEKNDKFISFFKKEKQNWNHKLQSLYETIYQDNISKNNAKPLIDAQAMTLNYRQELNDKISEYANTLTSVKADYRHLNQLKLLFYSTNFPLKLSVAEKKLLAEGNLRENIRQSQIIESHIEYLRESMRTLESFNYSVKNVIALMEYLGK